VLEAISGLLPKVAAARAAFAPRMRVSADAAWRGLAARGLLHPEAEPPDLALPEAFADTLAAAIAVEEAEGTGRAETLRTHYLDLMPSARVEQVATRAEPNATIFYTPLDLAKMPRLAGALERLAALLAAARVPADRGLPAELAHAPTLARLYARTYYGGFMPLLYGYPADLARAGRALDAGAPVHEVLDRYLTAPLIHELSHLGRQRYALLPLYLDECVAGHIGVRVLPELAYPAAGEANGLYAAPWFAQVGQALARLVGIERLVAAHAGLAAWADVIGPELSAALRHLGWQDYLAHRGAHLLSDAFHPEPWLEAIGAPPDESEDEDTAIVVDALRAMCLFSYVAAQAYHVETRAPAGPIRVDLAARRVTVADHGATPPPAYPFPAALARRLQASGIQGFHVSLRDPAQIPALARVLREGSPGQRVVAAGYDVEPSPARESG
jgi:hypothetical protein